MSDDTKDGNGAQKGKQSSAYKVGYKKPPKHTQFKPGVSGNPSGRPPRKKDTEPTRIRRRNAHEDFLRIMDKPITITIEGQPEKMSIYEALILQATKKGLSGHGPTLRFLLNQWPKHWAAEDQQQVELVRLAMDLEDAREAEFEELYKRKEALKQLTDKIAEDGDGDGDGDGEN